MTVTMFTGKFPVDREHGSASPFFPLTAQGIQQICGWRTTRFRRTLAGSVGCIAVDVVESCLQIHVRCRSARESPLFVSDWLVAYLGIRFLLYPAIICASGVTLPCAPRRTARVPPWGLASPTAVGEENLGIGRPTLEVIVY